MQMETQKEPFLPYSAPPRLWDKVGVAKFRHWAQKYLIMVDYQSGYFEVDRLSSKRVANITYALCQQFARHPRSCQILAHLVRQNSKTLLPPGNSKLLRHRRVIP